HLHTEIMKNHFKQFSKIHVLFFLTLVLLSAEAFTQDFNKRERLIMEKFEIVFDSIDHYNEVDLLNLQAFLKKDKQYRRRKRTGIIMASAGAVITGLGIVGIATNSADYEARPFVNILGGTVIAVGSATAGLSIPFFCSSKKKKRDRDKLISKLTD
ncbi:MAG: hypothetical protein WA951_14420, partial [Leeuwenhoekiella sp.]